MYNYKIISLLFKLVEKLKKKLKRLYYIKIVCWLKLDLFVFWYIIIKSNLSKL